MHDHVAGQLVGEGFAAHFVVGSGPLDAVRQLDDADDGESAFYVAAGGANALDDSLDGLSAPFTCDEEVTPGLLIKWALTQVAPSFAKRIAPQVQLNY